MHAGSLLLPALALGLGCLIALAWLIYRLTRARGRESSLLACGGSLALLCGAGAVLALWPEDRRATLQFESADEAQLSIAIGERELGHTPLEISLAEFFSVTSEVPRVLPSDARRPTAGSANGRARGVEVRTRHGLEGVHVEQLGDQPAALNLRIHWGPMLPGRTDTYPLRAAASITGSPARLADVRLQRSGLLGKGPRRYRVVLRAQ